MDSTARGARGNTPAIRRSPFRPMSVPQSPRILLQTPLALQRSFFVSPCLRALHARSPGLLSSDVWHEPPWANGMAGGARQYRGSSDGVIEMVP